MIPDGLRRRLAELFRPGLLDRESREELSDHAERVVAEKLARGVDVSEARRQARLELGAVDGAREDLAQRRAGFAVEQCVREVRHAARVLRRAPATTTVSVLTMAIGIGASVALFAIVDAILLRPLPYAEPERLVRIFDTNVRAGIDRSGVTTGNLFEWRQRAPAFSGISGYYIVGRTLSTDAEATPVIAAQVTADFFRVGGVSAALGRTFTTEDTERARFNTAAMPTGADPVVILSHDTWRSRFGANPQIVGQRVLLERLPFTVVGVMPRGFALPRPDTQVWIPWRIDADSPRDQHYLGSIARLAPHIPLGDAERQLARVASDLAAIYPQTNDGWSVRLVPLKTDVIGGSSQTLWLLLGAVGLLLLVACANVALLTFTRGFDRAGEVAVRLALGASSSRLMREFLIESALQATVAGALGFVLASVSLRVLPAVAIDLPRVGEVAIAPLTFVCVFALTVLSAVLSGLPHAWKRSRAQPMAALSAASLRTTRSGAHAGLRHAMAVAQVALAVVLLTGAGLLVRSVLALAAVDIGFDPRGVLVLPVSLDTQAYKTPDHVRAYYQALIQRLSALPNVSSVGAATMVPASPLGRDFTRPVSRAEGASSSAQFVPASVRIVTSGYASAIGLRLKAGRAIDDRDHATSPQVVMVSDGLARQLWPGENPVGQQLVVDYSSAGTSPYEVVGVVGEIHFRGPRSLPEREIYLAHSQRPYLAMNVAVRGTGDARGLASDVRRALREVDAQKPAQSVVPLEDLLRATYARDRLTMAMLVAFAVTATFLAMLSVYGVLSGLVRERVREIAIRRAMGANARALVTWVSAVGVRLVLVGLAFGLAATSLASRLLAGFLFGVAPSDLATTGAVVIAVSVAGAVATFFPCYRAIRLNPLEILRRG